MQDLNSAATKESGSILVTGATGLVGSHLIATLVNQGKKIKALYRSQIPVMQHASQVQWVKGDILDIQSLEDALAGVTQVYHCAAMVSFNPAHKHILYKTNVEGTANVVNACIDAGIEKLLFVSSVAALGRIREGAPITEQMHWTADTSNSEYGKTKYLAEMEVWRGAGEGLNVVIVNPTIILGCSDWNKGSAAIFKNVYNEFPWYTEGTTGFVDVADVVDAMVALMHSNISSERFIVSADNITYRQLFNLAASAFGKKQPHKKVSPLMAKLVWRVEAIKAMVTGSNPLLTKETSATAQAKVVFNNSKLLQYLPAFTYRSIPETVQRICNEFKQKYQLS